MIMTQLDEKGRGYPRTSRSTLSWPPSLRAGTGARRPCTEVPAEVRAEAEPVLPSQCAGRRAIVGRGASVILGVLLVFTGVAGSAQAQSLSLVKTANQANYSAAGQVLTYNFTVTNTGVDPLTNVTVSDPLATVSGGPIASLAAGASDSSTFTASYTVTQNDVDMGSVMNTATVTGTPPSGPAVTGIGSATVPALQSVTFILDKFAGQASYAAVGDVLTYTFTVTNTGNVTLFNIGVTDPLAAVVGGPIASLAPGAADSTTFTATYLITQADLDAGNLTNVATATASVLSGPGVTTFGGATVPAVLNPAVTLTKTAAQANFNAVGNVLTYTFTVANTGNVTLTNVTVTDPLAAVVGGPIASLGPGTSDSTTFTASYTVSQTDINKGSFTNTATVTGTPLVGAVATGSGSATVPALQTPALTLAKTPVQGSYSLAGDILTYKFTVTNTGNVPLANVTVTDPSATVTGVPIASLAPGAVDTTTFTASHTVTPADVTAGSFTNTATVTGTPPVGTNVTATAGATVKMPSIAVTKTALQANFNAAGNVLTYTFTVTNTGPVALTNVTLTDPSATVSGGPIASLAPGAVDTTTFTASHTVAQSELDAGSFANTATVTGTPPTGPNVTASASATVPGVRTPSITLAKTAVQANFSAAGDVLNYTFTVTNTGNVTLTNVVVTDPSATVAGGPIASLAPGVSNTTIFTASHTVTQAEVNAGSFSNTATVTGTPPVGANVTAVASATVPALNTPFITLTKTAMQANYSAVGNVLTYTLTVKNAGNVTLTNVTVTDPSATVTGGPIASLAPGASDSATFSASHTVTQADLNAGNYTNTATATGTPPGGPNVTGAANATVPAATTPSLALTETAGQANYNAAGNVLTYTFTVTNTGNVPLSNVTLTDPSATVSGGPIASLAPGASDSMTFTASHTVTQADLNAGSYTNTATVTATPPSGPNVTASHSATVSAVQTPAITLMKTAAQPNYNAVGNVLTYTFTVTNTGNVTLTNVTLTDPSATVAGGPIASLAPGASDSTTFTASHTVTQANINAGSFTNTATVTGTPPSGPNVTASHSATVSAVRAPSITLTKTAAQANYHAVGDLLTYTFTVTNTGNVTLTNVTLTDPSATVAGGPIASLAPGASDSTTFTASHTVTQANLNAGSYTNTATITGTPPSGPNVTASHSATVSASNSAAITLAKTAVQANFSAAGDVLTYTFTVTNTGNVTLTNVTVTDPSATVSGGPIASLAPGASDSMTFTASHTVTQANVNAGSYTNTATATGTPPTGAAVTGTDSVTVPAANAPSIHLVKTAVQHNYAAVGDVLTYTFTVSNTCNVPLTNVTVTDPAATVTGGPIASLAPGASNSTAFTASHTVTQSDINAGSYANTATVTGTPPSGPVVTGSDTVTVSALKNPAIHLVKSAVQSNYTSTGDVLDYTFTVTNTGNVTLNNVTVTDPSATVSSVAIASLAPGASDSTTFTASHTVTQADVMAGSYTNTATVTGTPPTGAAVTATDSVTVSARSNASIQLVKAAVQLNYGSVGDVLTYTFNVSNTGNAPLANVTVTDPSATVSGGPILSLAPGVSNSTTFTAIHTVTQADIDAGSYTNTATATGTPPSGPAVSASDTVTVSAVAHAAITLSKTAAQASFDAVGNVLTYTFTVTNMSNVALTNVTVTDPTATVTGVPITLAPGDADSTAFTASHTVTQANINAGSYTNTATATGTPPSGPAVSASDSVTVTAVRHPSVSLVAASNPATFSAAGDVLNYTFTVTNTGNVTLTNVTITDPLITVAGGPIASLVPGASDSTTFTGTYTVTAADVAAGTVESSATVTGNNLAGPPATGTDSVMVALGPGTGCNCKKFDTTDPSAIILAILGFFGMLLGYRATGS